MGFGTRSCMVFCYLNAACAVFISYLFRIGISSMAIVSIEKKWDRQAKARAIFNAGIWYLVLAVAMTVKSVLDDRRELREHGDVHQRASDFDFEFGPGGDAEAAPLLDRRPRTRNDSAHGGGANSSSVRRHYGGAS